MPSPKEHAEYIDLTQSDEKVRVQIAGEIASYAVEMAGRERVYYQMFQAERAKNRVLEVELTRQLERSRSREAYLRNVELLVDDDVAPMSAALSELLGE